jgi:catechol 2,3-dioxygenase-like lactoylglutathione lyase family enzyme
MAQIIGPDFVALQVRDLEASRRFYTERLGLEPAPQSPPGAVVFQTTPIPFAIREPAVDLAAANRLGWGMALWLNCDDAEALCVDLRANGVAITQEPFDGPFGRTFAFVDPDGYPLTAHSGGR